MSIDSLANTNTNTNSPSETNINHSNHDIASNKNKLPPPDHNHHTVAAAATTLSSNQFLVEDFDLSNSREKSNQSDSMKASDLEDNKESADIDGISTLELSEGDINIHNQINKHEESEDIDNDAGNTSFEYTISKRDAIETVPGVLGGKAFDFEENQDVVLLGTANFGTAYIYIYIFVKLFESFSL